VLPQQPLTCVPAVLGNLHVRQQALYARRVRRSRTLDAKRVHKLSSLIQTLERGTAGSHDVERRLALSVACAHVASDVKEQPQELGVAGSGCRMNGRTEQRVDVIRIPASVEESPDRVVLAVRCGGQQRRHHDLRQLTHEELTQASHRLSTRKGTRGLGVNRDTVAQETVDFNAVTPCCRLHEG